MPINTTVQGFDVTNPAQSYELMKKLWGKMAKIGIKPHHALKVSNEVIEDTYQMAHYLYINNKPEESLKFFRHLVTFDPNSYRFCFGLAACLQRLKEYKEAIGWYTVASVSDQTNPLPTYHATQCYMEIDGWQGADFFCNKTIELAGDNPEYKTLKDHSLAYKHGIEHKLKKIKS